MSSDAQDEAEALDSDKLGDVYPPDEPLGVDEYGTTPAEERIDEPLEERVARDQPDEPGPAPDRTEVDLVAEPEIDTEAELVAEAAEADPDRGEFDDDDASERLGDAEVPAEVQAVHETR